MTVPLPVLSSVMHLTGYQVQMQDMACGLCGKPFSQEDSVPLIGTPEQVQALRQQLDRRRAKKASKEGSRAKKRKLNTAGTYG